MKLNINYIDDTEWLKQMYRYANAQALFDEKELGWIEVDKVKTRLVGNTNLCLVHPNKLKEILIGVEKRYRRMK